MAKRKQTFQRAARKRKAAQRARAAARVEYEVIGEEGQDQPTSREAGKADSQAESGEAESGAEDEQA